MLVSARNQPPYAVIPVGHGLPHPGVGKDMAFDLAGEHLYVLTGDVVSIILVIFPLDSVKAFQLPTL
ncbi:hypothetical protein LSH36_550g01024 [Paralvinella palmiformis]|uniref:Uncharacterized protein n=1 Tax=Paralvinella palmiformis TaxID=53620 RepID=A0AAD9J6P1_9ANNE|nr:hypothetical protein LSH36_550g01024 [Paralvinella palmiformis]